MASPCPFNAFQLLKNRNGQALHGCLTAREIHEADALGAAFPEAHGHGGTRCSAGFRSRRFFVGYADARGRDSRCCPGSSRRSLVRATRHRVVARRRRRRSGRRREEVPGCENGEIRSRPVRFGLRADGGVVAADAVDEVPLLVFNAFAGLDHSDVPIPKIRDGADDELGLTVRAVRAEGSRVRGRPRSSLRHGR